MTEELPVPHESAAEIRQTTRLASIPEIYRSTHERLACELALHMDDAESIFAAYNYSPEQAADLCESPAFVTLLERVTREIRESGLSFKTKAKMQAEELLASSFELATDPYVSPAVRAQIIQWTAKMAGHEPKDSEDKGKGAGTGLTLSITFAGNQPQQVFTTTEPFTIEQEREE